MYGDDGDDTIQGAGDADQIYGNEGNDVLMGGTEPNTNNAGDKVVYRPLEHHFLVSYISDQHQQHLELSYHLHHLHTKHPIL